MRRRRDWLSLFLLIPVVSAGYDSPGGGYDAKPISTNMMPQLPSPYLPPRVPVARGYQPPPQPALFEPPRSYYTVQHHHNRGQMPAIKNPPPRPPTNWASPRPLDLEAERQLLFEAERRIMTMRNQPRFNEDDFLIQAVGGDKQSTAPKGPVRQPDPPHRLIYSEKFTGPPAATPVPPPPPKTSQKEVPPALNSELSSIEENPPDLENNIIVHIYLNSKEKGSAHAITKIGPIHGLFGIGTAHGGPGTHENPIVVVKDFDRDTLKFVDPHKANEMMEEGPANIVEVKAMVSTPNRTIIETLNKAVDSELNRAIPVVLNRFHGSMGSMDGDLRKELEQALVDEIAKNLGDTIDSMSPGDVTEEDLNQLIDEGFESSEKITSPTTPKPSTHKITVVTMTTVTFGTSTKPSPTTPRPTQAPTTRRITTEASTRRVTSTSNTTTSPVTTTKPTTKITTAPWIPPTFRVTTQHRLPVTTVTQQPKTMKTQPTVAWSPETERTTPSSPPRSFRITTLSTTQTPTTRRVTVAPTTTRPPAPPTTSPPQPIEVVPAKIPIDFGHDNSLETQEPVETRPTPRPTQVPTGSWTRGTVAPAAPGSEENINIVTSRPIKVINFSEEEEETEVVTVPAGTVTATFSPRPQTTHSPTTSTLLTTSPTSTRLQQLPTATLRPGVIHFMGDESEEEVEEKEKGITKGAPQSFGEMNMMRKGQEIEEEETVPPFTTPPTTVKPSSTTVQAYPTVPSSSASTARVTEVPSSSSRATVTANVQPSTRKIVSSQPTQAAPSTPLPTEPFITHDVFEVTSTEHPPWEAQPSETDETSPTGMCPTPNDASDRARSDVLFLLDSSNKFTEDKFMHSITLILNTVEQLRNIGPDGVQVSLVQFNTEPYLEFSLRKHNCKQFLKDDIADTQYMTGGSMLGRALEKVMKFAFTKKRGDRPDAENILIILTDGQSEDKVQLPVQVSKDHNVTIYVIGTLEANPEYLKNLSGKAENVFQLTGAENTPLASQLATKIAKNQRAEVSLEESEDDDGETIQTVPNRRPIDANDVSDENIPPFPPTRSGMVHLECSTEGFRIKFNLPGKFEGHAVVKGREKESQCQLPIKSDHSVALNRTLNFFIPTDSCGVSTLDSEEPAGKNSSVIVHLVHAPTLRTGEDRAFLLQCFIGGSTEGEVETHLDVVKSEVTIAETISLSTLPPSCTYSIRKDRHDGPIITRATVGQAVYHRWDCDGDEKTNNVFGIKVHNCFASDDVEQKYPIVDANGCSSDLALLTNPVYEEDHLSAYALSHVFGVLEHDSLKFVCKLSLCTRDGDGCEGITPPQCSDNHTDLLVWKPASNPYDSALTSALSTKVDIGEEPLYTKVVSTVIESKVFLAISGLMLFAAATLLVVHKLRQQQYIETPSSYRSRASSHFETSSSDESQNSGPIPDPRLTEFLKNFDRSRYV